MDALRQIFNDHCPARGATLTCPAWVNRSHTSTSVRRFIGRVSNQLTPRRILNALTQTVILNHASDVQIFKGNESEHRNERVAELMCEVTAAISYALMDASCRLAFLFSLCLRKCLLIYAKESWVSYLFAYGKCGKRVQANIYPNHLIALRQRLCFHFHREASVPLAGGRACDGERLNFAFNGAVQLDSHVPDFRETQASIFEDEAGLSVGERIVSFARAEAREACLLLCFDAPKECLKGFIQSPQYVLQYLAVNVIEFGACFFNLRQLIRLLNVADGLSLKTVCVSSLLQARIIELAAQCKCVVQACRLGLTWIDSKPESSLCYFWFSHMRHASIVSYLGESRNAVGRSVPARLHYSTRRGANLGNNILGSSA